MSKELSLVNKEQQQELVKICPCFAKADFGDDIKPDWNLCIVPCSSQLEYLQKRDEFIKESRGKLLTQMVRDAEEMGLYNLEEE